MKEYLRPTYLDVSSISDHRGERERLFAGSRNYMLIFDILHEDIDSSGNLIVLSYQKWIFVLNYFMMITNGYSCFMYYGKYQYNIPSLNNKSNDPKLVHHILLNYLSPSLSNYSDKIPNYIKLLFDHYCKRKYGNYIGIGPGGEHEYDYNFGFVSIWKIFLDSSIFPKLLKLLFNKRKKVYHGKA